MRGLFRFRPEAALSIVPGPSSPGFQCQTPAVLRDRSPSGEFTPTLAKTFPKKACILLPKYVTN